MEKIENRSNDIMNSLQTFDKPDEDIIAYLTDDEKERIELEIGTNIYYETDDMSDDEIIDWATDQGYFDEEEEEYYLNADKSPNVDSLRSARKANEEEYPSPLSTPAGRAYYFFENIYEDWPDDIKIHLIDSFSPGDNSYAAIVYGIKTLKALQEFLLKRGQKVNFTLLEVN